MWSNEQEAVRKSFFFFFNWILGPQDEMCQETNGLRNHYPNGLKDFGKRQEDKLR